MCFLSLSRFGPISRKGMTHLRSKPSQSQAIIDDQPLPTPVVSNSKQMARPVPPLQTAFLHQNNGIIDLKPFVADNV